MTAFDNVDAARQRGTAIPPGTRCCRTRALIADERAVERRRTAPISSAQGSAQTGAQNLSYGPQRKLEIARALATTPKLLILDEPAAGSIDRNRRGRDLVRKVCRDRGITVLLVEHDMRW